jgi:hypothetical protein
MPFSIAVSDGQIRYVEKGIEKLYIAIAKVEGKTNLLMISGHDDFEAGIRAKYICDRVLFMVDLAAMLELLKEHQDEYDALIG